jgi:murein DD-endopeptidase MepM/ murein hydrolase activator NlpD
LGLSHSNGYTSRYAHLKNGSIKVRKDDKVINGEVVGLSGMTGGATGLHLHLEILLNGKPVNPMLIADLQELLYEEDDTLVIELPEVIVIGKSMHKEKSLEERSDDMLWLFVRPNAYGNTGHYNKPDRASDQYYSDEFLKWYYDETGRQS